MDPGTSSPSDSRYYLPPSSGRCAHHHRRLCRHIRRHTQRQLFLSFGGLYTTLISTFSFFAHIIGLSAGSYSRQGGAFHLRLHTPRTYTCYLPIFAKYSLLLNTIYYTIIGQIVLMQKKKKSRLKSMFQFPASALRTMKKSTSTYLAGSS